MITGYQIELDRDLKSIPQQAIELISSRIEFKPYFSMSNSEALEIFVRSPSGERLLQGCSNSGCINISEEHDFDLTDRGLVIVVERSGAFRDAAELRLEAAQLIAKHYYNAHLVCPEYFEDPDADFPGFD